MKNCTSNVMPETDSAVVSLNTALISANCLQVIPSGFLHCLVFHFNALFIYLFSQPVYSIETSRPTQHSTVAFGHGTLILTWWSRQQLSSDSGHVICCFCLHTIILDVNVNSTSKTDANAIGLQITNHAETANFGRPEIGSRKQVWLKHFHIGYRL